MNTAHVSIGISLRRSTLKRIDESRGDVPRSRAIERMIEASLGADPDREDQA